ncbi:MAG: hypothetical protein ABIH00_04920 [Armatimonadota bacterium]
MKKYVFLLIAAMLLFNFAVFAQEPGSAQDPVITKSYLDNFYKWRSITLKQDQTLILDLSTEIVVISGEVEVTSYNSGYLIDLTGGTQLFNAGIIPLFHLILSPGSDGRGMKALTDSEILIKGMIR